MGGKYTPKICTDVPDAPEPGFITLFFKDAQWQFIDENGVVSFFTVDPESVQDIVGAMTIGGQGIDVVYDDGAGTLTISIDGPTWTLIQNAIQPGDNVSELVNDAGYLTETTHDALPSDNPHGVTAAQVGADPIGTAAAAVTAHENSITNHDDIDTAGATNGQVLTWDGSNWIPGTPSGGGGAKTVFFNNTADNNNTDTPKTFLTGNFNFDDTKQYLITSSYRWSLNVTQRNFEGDLTIGGVAQEPWQHRDEPHDSGGGGPYGTDQRKSFGITAVYSPASSGTVAVQVEFACQQNGDNAAMYNATIVIEEI